MSTMQGLRVAGILRSAAVKHNVSDNQCFLLIVILSLTITAILLLQLNTWRNPPVATIELSTASSVQYTNPHILLYIGEITIGGQPFLVQFDTAYNNLWIPSILCTHCNCTNKFNPATANAHTFGSFSDAFSGVSGQLVQGNVSVAGFSTQTLFGLVESSPRQHFQPYDGLFGMSYKSTWADGTQPILPTLGIYQFAFDLKHNQLQLGGYNTSLQIHWLDLTSESPSYYDSFNIYLANLTMNGKQYTSMHTAIVDTGQSLLIGPYGDVSKLWDSFNGWHKSEEIMYDGRQTKVLHIDCEQVAELADIEITLYDTKDTCFTFVFSPEQYVLNVTRADGLECFVGIAGFDGDFWVLGNLFLQQKYVVFDMEHKRIGFGVDDGNAVSVSQCRDHKALHVRKWAAWKWAVVVISSAVVAACATVFVWYRCCGNEEDDDDDDDMEHMQSK